MRAVAQKKPSEDHKRQRNITNRHTDKKPLFSFPFLSNDNITIQRKPLCPCDGSCPRCSGTIQPKLIFGQPYDKYEQEADRVADEVMRMPELPLQRQVEPEEEETLQTKPLTKQITPLVQRQAEEEEEEEEEESLQTKENPGQTPEVTPDLESHINSLKGGGQPLFKSERAFFESRFGYNFSQVRVHTYAQAVRNACALNAQAFTVGKDIVFGTGQYTPDTITGKKLLAHELTHVVQQDKKLKTVNDSKTRIQAKLSLGPISASNITGPPKQRLKKHLFNYAYWELDGPSKNKIFSLLRKHYATFKDDNEVREQLEGYLREDDRWYGLVLFHYGTEKNWPFPSRFLPPNAVPNTKGKLFEMLRNLADEERTPKLKQFIYRTFKSGTQDRYLALYLFHMGASGLKEWLITLLKVRTFGKIKKGKVFHLLRTYHSIVKGDKRVETLLKEKFVEDDRWYGLGLFFFGDEKMWPLPAKYKSPKAPNTKGKFFDILRKLYDEEGKPEKPKAKPKLLEFIEKVFEHGDRVYAVNLCKYGTEYNWPEEIIKKLASDPGVQPELTKEATGYKLFKGEEYLSGISYKDIEQGQIGDCYLMAALAAIAKVNPKVLDKMVYINKNGVFTVTFYDPYRTYAIHKEYVLPGFPVRDAKIVYGGSKTKGELWVSIVEKAYAAWHGPKGGYEWIGKGGKPLDVLEAILGKRGDYFTVSTIDYSKSPIARAYLMSALAMIHKIMHALANGRPIVAATFCEPKWKEMKLTGAQKLRARRYWRQKVLKEIKKALCANCDCHGFAVFGILGSKVQLYNPHGTELKVELSKFHKIISSLSIGPKIKK
jgi:hypothetical protein